jgi:hypothetical protein
VKGIEPENPQAQSSENQPVKSSAENGYTQIPAQIKSPIDSDLEKVISAWLELSFPIKAAILALIGTAKGTL